MSDIPILYRDQRLIIADKPSGLLVHPYWKETSEKENLMMKVRDQVGQWVYTVNRLDRPVSGPVLFGLDKEIVKEVQLRWHFANTIKEYIALVRGHINEPGEFNRPLKNDKKVSQKARTQYWPMRQFEDSTLVRIRIKTGRKHQIRRHFSHDFHFILGDTIQGYGRVNRLWRDRYDLHRIFLHCRRLAIEHPETEEMIDVSSPLPKELVHTLEKMGEKVPTDL